MMPPRPRAPLEVIEPQLVLELAVILFNAPAALGEAHEPAQPQMLPTEIGEPVRRGGFGVGRPLDEQFDRRRGQRPPAAYAVGSGPRRLTPCAGQKAVRANRERMLPFVSWRHEIVRQARAGKAAAS